MVNLSQETATKIVESLAPVSVFLLCLGGGGSSDSEFALLISNHLSTI